MRRFLERFGADVVIGFSLALVVTGAAFVFANPHLHPSVWSAYAAGTGLRPAAEVQPAVWTLLARGLTALIGPVRVVDYLPWVGRCLLGLFGGIAYWGILGQLELMSPRATRPLRQLAILRLAAFVSAVAFATSDSLWTGAQSFSPGFLSAGLFFIAVYAFQRFYFWGSRLTASLCAVCLALALVDTPLAIVPLAVLGYVLLRRWVKNSVGDEFRRHVSTARWPAFACAVAAYAVAMYLGVRLYWNDWSAVGETPNLRQMLDVVVVSWVQGFGREAPLLGWTLLVGLTCGPLIGLGYAFKRACDEEVPFSFLGLVCFVLYIVFAFFQFVGFGCVGVFDVLSFRLFPGETVRFWSTFAYAFCLALAFTVVATEVFARRIVWKQDKVSSALFAVAYSASARFRIRWRRVAGYSIALFVLSLFVVLFLDGRRQALCDVHDYIAAVLDDAKGCTDICTDGRLDDGFRLEAARRGVTLYPRPMITRGSRLLGLMQRVGLDESELLLAADGGAAACLRSMIRDFPERLKTVAVQVGFEAWRFDLKPLPPAWGTLGRLSGTVEERARSRAAADALSERLCEPSSRFVRFDMKLSDALDVVRWRLSQMVKFRAEEADRLDDVKTSEQARALQKRLDAANDTYVALKEDLARSKRYRSRAMSPREILHMALLRGDSTACGALATAVLKTDPDNLEAHFAMAISCASNDDYRGAENHFRFCLRRRPNDPALLNNLALTLHNLGKYEDACDQAERAREIAPHVDEIRDTLARIHEAQSIVATNGVPQKIRLAVIEKD